MKRFFLISMLALSIATFAGTAAAADRDDRDDASEKVRSISKSFSAADAKGVALENSVGSLTIEAASGGQVSVELSIRCEERRKKCIDTAEKIELVSSTEGGRLNLRVEGFPKSNSRGMNVDMTVRMPADLDLRAELGVGNVELKGLKRDIDLEVGVGHIEARVPERAVKSASLEAGVGNVELKRGRERLEGEGFVGKELSWTRGTGDARLTLHSGVGHIELELE